MCSGWWAIPTWDWPTPSDEVVFEPFVALTATAFAAAQGVRPRHFSGAAIERLRAYPWPGNLHELEAVVMQCLAKIPDDATHLVLSVGGNDALWTAGNIFSRTADDIRSSLHHIGKLVAEFTREYRRLVSDSLTPV